jgi:murein DD-endopeptidase MepM/ murein hydrolase activator NlpD
MTKRAWRRAAVLILIGSLVAGAVAVQANAESSVRLALRHRRGMLQQIVRLHKLRHDRRVVLHQRIQTYERRLQMGPGRAGDRTRYRNFRRAQRRQLWNLRQKERWLIRSTHRQVRELKQRREQLGDWLGVYGVFRACPVSGWHIVNDNFGIIVEKPGTPTHVHMGNDITAEYAAPILAPFSGTAVASTNALGGLAVKVYGEGGFVYNAHLSSYGRLGDVNPGDVIGYVGTSGNAGGPHNHFEWHPFNGGAVDPFPYLSAVC